MIQSQLEGVDFVVANTDAQALSHSRTDRRVQLGTNTTSGLGAGSRPDVGQASAEEAIEDILAQLVETNMAFITAGMGGGTGTGAAPIIARAAREQGILTVGVVTKPFQFEGTDRMKIAEAGIEELEQYVDTLIIIPNQNLFRVANEKTTFADAFKMADDVLYSGVRGVTDLIVMPGLINLDFADIRVVMSEMGKAMMGTGESDGERRALDAAEAAISNPLLDDTSMKGATGVLINITGGSDMTLFEVDEAANRIRDEVDPEAHIIFGSTFDENTEGRIRVSIVATGMEVDATAQTRPAPMNLPPAMATTTEPAPPATVVHMRPAAENSVPAVAAAEAGAPGDDDSTAPADMTEAAGDAPRTAIPAADAADGADTGDAFIPPAAADPSIPDETPAPDPFAAAAMANGATEAEAGATRQPAKGPRPSLFEMVTGTGRAAKAAKAEAEAPVAEIEVPEAAPEPILAAPEADQTQLGGMNPTDRLMASQAEEDLLDIPAFLRRQAN
jgi:cell division protein FtsZ